MPNSSENTPGNSTEQFKQALSTMKEFILSLIIKKKERVEQDTKSKVDIIVPPDKNIQPDKPQNIPDSKKEQSRERSWFDSLKDKLLSNTPEQEEHQDIQKQEEHQDIQKQEDHQDIQKQEEHFLDQDEYTPQDSEFGEAMGVSPRFAEIHPPYMGYYISSKKSYFDPQTNKWAKKKQLRNIDIITDTGKEKHIYAGVMPAGLVAIPLPSGSLPDVESMIYNGNTPPIFQIDQNKCIYIKCQEKQYVSFNFHRNQNIDILPPIREDSEKIIYQTLSKAGKATLNSLQGISSAISTKTIREYIIKTTKYSTKQQGSLRKKSNHRNYISNLDASPVLECYSTASLFAGMCRELGIPCRIVFGHMSQKIEEGKSLLGSNNAHTWNEFWDESSQRWIHIDATPQIKEGDDNNDRSGEKNQFKNDSQQGDDSSGTSDNSEEPQENNDSGNNSEQSEQSSETSNNSASGDASEPNKTQDQEKYSKSPNEVLEKLIEQAKEDSLSQQAEKLKNTIEKLEDTINKEDIRKILDDADLSDFAKDMIDDIGNKEILKQEQDELQNTTDESEIEILEENSLLNDDYKKKLSEYAKSVKKKIEKKKKHQKSKMDQMGFKDNELHLFHTYIALEKEVDSEVRSQIHALERILPKQYKRVEDQQHHYRTGTRIASTGKLIEHTLTGDPNIFRRDQKIRESNEIHMFESIIIDRSGSMGKFDDPHSPMRASIKAAIIRAKVLEHFKVEFNILLFDDDIEEVMSFGEVYTDRKLNTIPSRLMKALQKSGRTNIGEPLAYALSEMEGHNRKKQKKIFGNISFIGDGKPRSGLRGAGLTALVDEIRNKGYGLTAYYIGGSSQDKSELEGYFGKEKNGGTVIVSDISQLTEKIISSHNNNLRNVIRRYSK